MNTGKAARTGLHVVAAHSSLWGLFRQGDRNAFEAIYEKYIDDLYHYGMHCCADHNRVKDCLQDLFQDLWVTREHLTEEIRNIRYYLISCLRRRLLKNSRIDQRYQHPESWDAFEFDFSLPQEHLLIQNETKAEQQRLLQQALNQLTRRQREAIYLRFYQNLSYQEVANIMAMQVDSVYNTISKAISILKKNLPLPLLLILLKS
ncbi:RNA polymerase sigma factor, sigma-70 family [Chitinophaga terrae (ex Kim and Jung 2007)]|uniref:RNA polymerase sigma factor, sigma-70 family n=1 Tax=Chitinophaga terrae (ex Kim and Jung 2007) TaxID=408074 RepID=A0A1H4EM15_9BACT|nr:sigma-70 family RNA polymerase sigma factor [Chitinophaga terrae (ex Kim and Jung 2007)]GEP91719.1 DNA-directed RNA polymerase sigma-70 factor [Chitinophaga terrae (ex Kim and Jung 2007)]SEA85937.1 RNA polymerase sigma factor, sigma-70 family [Chitinophaga terrae (ex Kim and Jung 2007)]